MSQENRKSWFYNFVLCVLGLFTLSWFRFTPIIDRDMTLGTTLSKTSLSYVWQSLVFEISGFYPNVYPGEPQTPTSLFQSAIVNLSHTVFPLWFSQWIYVYVCAVIALFGVFRLVRFVFSKISHLPSWVGVLSSFLYFYGPFYEFVIGDGAFAVLGFYACYPWLVYFSIRLLEARDRVEYASALLGFLVCGIPSAPAFTYYYLITGFASIIVAVVLWSVFMVKGFTQKLLGVLKFFVGFFVFLSSISYILVNDVSSGPTLAQASSGLPSLLFGLLKDSKELNYVKELTMNYWPAPAALTVNSFGVPSSLTNALWGASLFSASFLVLISRKEVLKPIFPFVFVLLLYVAIGAGLNPPFGAVLKFFYLRFWPVRAVTELFTSLDFVIQLCISLILGFSLASLSVKKPLKTALALVFLVCVAALSAPFALGTPLPITRVVASPPPSFVERVYSVSARVHIPQSFYQMVEYVNSLPQKGAVLLLPIAGNFRTTYWYISVDALSSVLNKPVVGGGYVSTQQTSALINLLTGWEQGYTLNITRLLALMGVGYIIVEGDASSAPSYTPQPPFDLKQILSKLNKTQGVSLLAVFSPYYVYSVSWDSGNASSGIYWPSKPYGYGFALSGFVKGKNPAPWSPFMVEFNLSSQSVQGSGCALSDGGLTLFSQSYFGKANTTMCLIPLNKTFSEPFYLSFGYTVTPGAELAVSLENKTEASGILVSGAHSSLGGSVTGSGFQVFQFAPGFYKYVSVIAYPINLSEQTTTLARVDWLYISYAAFPTQLLLPSSFVDAPLYATGNISVNTIVLPKVRSWICGALSCTVKLQATQPFVFVWYTAYSENARLRVNGKLDDSHFAVLGSFNGWFIDSKGNLTLSVSFANPLLPWEMLSLFTFVFAFFTFVFALIVRKRPFFTPFSQLLKHWL
ncbi:hypothetical protein B9Q10_02045 [Candidatus Marsarchaeota G2 archaeon ECH_B_SAG-E12]|uniref:Uncharacterized protein n=1 Tax=Candidatus Marsarchaeota G2 archaeon ECH_B_SAG-E12 TaxID=1978164 RepID=A0A2R6BT23_9ARCH|nr:MAG: hypothetical protein B9Q10_02045 [Candidatus Marsarchaeota G2 archaeon ECH_B_SAG-E12]